MRVGLLVLVLVFVTPGGGVDSFVGRVAVYGDAGAAHVAVVVPGSDVDGARFDATVGRMARSLHDVVGADVAVVAWLGYRTPSGLGVDAASGRLARAGAEALVRYVRSLSGHVHLLCHSYGSVVCAMAVRDVRVDDVVFLGSPGVRVSTVDELGTSARVWAARGARDWTRWVPAVRVGDLGHGADPVSPSFGAVVFDVGDARHDGYFESGSASLRALAAIARGGRP
ncbi:alpha/beta hydrolase [Actinosynnema sp. NPDC020468]|uniref:alpha/beta hydrolase n=1 Tax=Actinosynnema sp. NPDC020468 TaxID=3154488 RepID=UPI003409D124